MTGTAAERLRAKAAGPVATPAPAPASPAPVAPGPAAPPPDSSPRPGLTVADLEAFAPRLALMVAKRIRETDPPPIPPPPFPTQAVAKAAFEGASQGWRQQRAADAAEGLEERQARQRRRAAFLLLQVYALGVASGAVLLGAALAFGPRFLRWMGV